MKILFVEDDRDVARIVKEGLSSDAFTVEIAEDGNDGSFFARSYEYVTSLTTKIKTWKQITKFGQHALLVEKNMISGKYTSVVNSLITRI